MKCPQCDAEIDGGCIFCPKCGERLQGLEAETFAELREPADETTAAASPVAPQGASAPGALPAPGNLAPDAHPAAPAVDLGDTVTLWSGRYAFKGMIDRLALSALVTLALVLAMGWWSWARKGWPVALALLILLWAYQFCVYVGRRFGHRYRLTPQTFFHERGLLVKSTSPIEIIRIDDITLKQTVLERLVGVGTIRILSNDTTDPLLVMKGIPDVLRVFTTIDQARRAERRRRAVRIDAV
jgi:membrane protein YdbS with pleckstrin-like domain